MSRTHKRQRSVADDAAELDALLATIPQPTVSPPTVSPPAASAIPSPATSHKESTMNSTTAISPELQAAQDAAALAQAKAAKVQADAAAEKAQLELENLRAAMGTKSKAEQQAAELHAKQLEKLQAETEQAKAKATQEAELHASDMEAPQRNPAVRWISTTLTLLATVSVVAATTVFTIKGVKSLSSGELPGEQPAENK